MQKITTRALFLFLIVFSFFLGKYLSPGYEVDFNDIFTSNNSEEYESFTHTSETIQKDLMDRIVVSKGDTLSNILGNQNLPKNDIIKIIQLANQEKIASKLKIGQEIIFEYKVLSSTAEDNSSAEDNFDSVKDNNGKMSLATEDEDSTSVDQSIENIQESQDDNEQNRKLYRMTVSIDKLKNLDFIREEGQEGFKAQYSSAELKKLVTKYETIIENSLVESLNNQGLSNNAIIKLINTYSHQIDFQRQIRSGDKITVVAEKYMTEDDQFSHHGKILYSTLTTGGQEYEICLYSPDGSDDNMQYFNAEGRSIKSALLKTPINATRISGHYGYREKHPVLGYGRMHKGVDFAAPNGTPIYSAGDGVIEFTGNKSGYGNFVIVKHNKELSTAYAHASKIPSSIKKGKSVKQGEIIAYV